MSILNKIIEKISCTHQAQLNFIYINKNDYDILQEEIEKENLDIYYNNIYLNNILQNCSIVIDQDLKNNEIIIR